MSGPLVGAIESLENKGTMENLENLTLKVKN